MSSNSEPGRVAVPAGRALASGQHHSWWTIALHWGSVVAIVVSVAAALWWDFIEDQALRVVLMNVHRQVGLVVLVAWVLRLMVRFRVGMADHSGESAAWMRWAAQAAHLALYALLLAMVLLGLALSNAHNVQITLFGMFPLPMLVGEDSDLAEALTDYHVWGAWALLALVAAHVAAACWHHWVRRDGVLVAMLPLAKLSGEVGDVEWNESTRRPV
jgi:cytochrome b561